MRQGSNDQIFSNNHTNAFVQLTMFYYAVPAIGVICLLLRSFDPCENGSWNRDTIPIPKSQSTWNYYCGFRHFLKNFIAYDNFREQMTSMLCYFMDVMFFVRLSGNADIGLVNPKGFSRSTRSYVCTCSNLCRTRGIVCPYADYYIFLATFLPKEARVMNGDE